MESLPGPGASLGKTQIRSLHRNQRLLRFASLNGSIHDRISVLDDSLASPGEVRVDRIEPRLIPVSSAQERLLFTTATLTWSVPVSAGFGRRMRFLVRDEQNGKLVGIIGLTDPVFNLRPRDRWIGWCSEDRKKRLVHVMDAFVLGSLPPYSLILGGKLVALLATSREVCAQFRRRYAGTEGLISGQQKDARLVLLTTTSALGRSSVYNRLSIPGSVKYITDAERDSVGSWFTQGYGHFHINECLFRRMVRFLADCGHRYAEGYRFGQGPNWRIRVIRQTCVELGLKPDALLQHGVRRQVFVVPLAGNARAFLRGNCARPRYHNMKVAEITAFWRERWAEPRSQRCPSWLEWDKSQFLEQLAELRDAAVAEGKPAPSTPP